jgi:hypothetical protein
MSLEKIIIKSRDFDPSKLSFGEVKTMKDIGAQFVPVTYEGKKLYMQTPEMVVPFGMSQFTKEGEEKKDNDNANWSLDLSFTGEDENPELRDLKEKLLLITDEVLPENAFKNVWIKDKKARGKGGPKSVSKDVISQLISDQVRYSTSAKALDENGNPKYSPTMKVKVPCYNGSFVCEAYGDDKTPVDKPLNEVLVKGSRAKCLLECGVVYLGTKISLTWKLNQVKVRQTARMAGYGFIDSDNENGDEEEQQETRSSRKQEKPTMIDSDEEESEEESEEEDSDDE